MTERGHKIPCSTVGQEAEKVYSTLLAGAEEHKAAKQIGRTLAVSWMYSFRHSILSRQIRSKVAVWQSASHFGNLSLGTHTLAKLRHQSSVMRLFSNVYPAEPSLHWLESGKTD